MNYLFPRDLQKCIYTIDRLQVNAKNKSANNDMIQVEPRALQTSLLDSRQS